MRHQAAWIFGAICPARDTGVALVMPDVGAEAMQALLQELSTNLPSDRHAVLVMDRAAGISPRAWSGRPTSRPSTCHPIAPSSIPSSVSGCICVSVISATDCSTRMTLSKTPAAKRGIRCLCTAERKSATEDGAELSAVWRPLGGVTLNASVTYLDSKVSSNFINYSPYVLSAADTVNFKGEGFPNTPKWSAHYGGHYDWALSDKLLAFVTADASYQSSTVGAFGAPSLAIKSYGLLNLSAGLQSLDKHWLVEVFGRNVTNTYYWNTVYWVGDSTLRYPGLPTTYGVRLSYKY